MCNGRNEQREPVRIQLTSIFLSTSPLAHNRVLRKTGNSDCMDQFHTSDQALGSDRQGIMSESHTCVNARLSYSTERYLTTLLDAPVSIRLSLS